VSTAKPEPAKALRSSGQELDLRNMTTHVRPKRETVRAGGGSALAIVDAALLAVFMVVMPLTLFTPETLSVDMLRAVVAVLAAAALIAFLVDCRASK
jgi:hypothetical protein